MGYPNINGESVYFFTSKVEKPQHKEEKGMDLKTRIEKVLSEILSDKYDAKIRISLVMEESEDVPRVQDDTVQSEMSKCS